MGPIRWAVEMQEFLEVNRSCFFRHTVMTAPSR
jgi:hypothetical protein